MLIVNSHINHSWLNIVILIKKIFVSKYISPVWNKNIQWDSSNNSLDDEHRNINRFSSLILMLLTVVIIYQITTYKQTNNILSWNQSWKMKESVQMGSRKDWIWLRKNWKKLQKLLNHWRATLQDTKQLQKSVCRYHSQFNGGCRALMIFVHMSHTQII